MTTYLALLRAVNVGGNNKLPMTELRSALEAAGFERVRTYIQSGNIVLDAPDQERGQLAERISALMLERFGVTTPAVIVTRDELSAAIDGFPFTASAGEEKLLHILFLADEPAPERIAKLTARRNERLAALAAHKAAQAKT